MTPDQLLLDALDDADDAGHVGCARLLCEEILDYCPDHGPTLIRYAGFLINLALYSDAASVLDRAESVVPRERLYLVFAQRGHSLRRMGDFSRSEELYLKAHALDPDDAAYLIYAGCAAFRRGDILRAEEFARKAVSCSEGCIEEALFNLGGYLLAQKRHAEARDCYLRALEMDPEYAIAKKRLADVERAILKQIAADQVVAGKPRSATREYVTDRPANGAASDESS